MGRVSEKTLRSRQYVVEKMPKDRQMAFRREILAIREHEQAAEREATAGGNVAASGTEAAALFRKEQERLVALNRELEDLEKHRERLVERLNKLNNVGQTAQPEKKTTADPYRCDHPANHALSTPTVSPDGTAATNSYAPVIERTTLPERSTSVPPPATSVARKRSHPPQHPSATARSPRVVRIPVRVVKQVGINCPAPLFGNSSECVREEGYVLCCDGMEI